jgi:tRNA threonylcarbamoyladenosine biosynthesis protein TsaB
MLLAIDTSTDASGVAFRDHHGIAAEVAWVSGRRHAEQVLPMIDHLLRNLDRAAADVEAVAVATGPGSWSGLRVGMSIAKALAVSHNVPIIGVPALDVLAYGLRRFDGMIVPMVRLGRDRYGAAVYRTAPVWERTTPFQNLALDDLPGLVDGGLFCGDVDDAARQLLETRLGSSALFAEGSDNVRRPAVLADLAWRRWQKNDVDDLVTLEPLYLGNPVQRR